MSDGLTTTAPELAWRTPAAWADLALADPPALLSDHAHCELGAAASAQGLIARHPELSDLVDRLAALAAEEMRHFRRVHRVLRNLGGTLAPIRTNPYAEGLVRAVDRTDERALLDRLLLSGLIERRSLERFQLLAAAARDRPDLEQVAALFLELGPSEEGHARLFVELSCELFPDADVPRRLGEWARREATLIRGLSPGPRIHSGPPPGFQESAPVAEGIPEVRLTSAGSR